MATTELSPFLSTPVPSAVTTSVTGNLPTFRKNDAERDRWQRWIDFYLVEWGRDPVQLADDGVDAPTENVIRAAIVLAQHLMAQGLPAPSNVTPDTSGGIVFERREGDVLEAYHIWDDGEIDYQGYLGTELIERHRLN